MITIDINLLTKQRVHLNNVIAEAKVSKAQIEALEGIQNLLDAVSDTMDSSGYTEVFKHKPIVNQKSK